MKPSRLFIAGGKEISSNEGTTQGDSIAMEMRVLRLMLLLSSIISSNTGYPIHVAFGGKMFCIPWLLVNINVDPTLVIT